MSGAKSRLSSLLAHLAPNTPAPFEHKFNRHTLSPTFFLPRAAAIEPDVRDNTFYVPGLSMAIYN